MSSISHDFCANMMSMGTDQKLRGQISQRMTELKISQSELARRLNISRQSANQILKGERGTIPQSLVDVLDALDLELVAQPKHP